MPAAQKCTKAPSGVPDISVLRANEIHPLKSGKKKDAESTRFKCHLCNTIWDTPVKAMMHVNSDGHSRLLKEFELRQRLIHLPKPCVVHVEALNTLLTDVAQKALLSPEEAIRRKKVADKLIEIITSAAPDIEMQLFGSLITGLSIAESDVNLTMWSKENATNILPGKLITRISTLLNEAKEKELKDNSQTHSSQTLTEKVLKDESPPSECQNNELSDGVQDIRQPNGDEALVDESISLVQDATKDSSSGVAEVECPAKLHDSTQQAANQSAIVEECVANSSSQVVSSKSDETDPMVHDRPDDTTTEISTNLLDNVKISLVIEETSHILNEFQGSECVPDQSVDSSLNATDSVIPTNVQNSNEASIDKVLVLEESVAPSSAPPTPGKSDVTAEPSMAATEEHVSNDNNDASTSNDSFLCNLKISYSHLFPPSIMIRDKQNVLYKITVLDRHHVESDKLVAKYCQVDPRVGKLALLFRKLARVADIDAPEKGALMGRAFPIMTIFYLQNKSAPIVLPNLQYILERNSAHIPKEAIYEVQNHDIDIAYLSDLAYLPKFFNASMSQECLAELWIGLLNFYVTGFKKQEYIASITDFHPIIKSHAANSSKRLIVQDPISKQNLCHTVTPAETYNFIQKQLTDALMYFSVPQMSRRNAKNKKGTPLFTNIKLEVLEKDDSSVSNDEIVGLTTKYIMDRTYLKPLRMIRKLAYEYAHSSTVSKDNNRIPFDLKAALEKLSLWMLEYICLQQPKPSFKVDASPLDLNLVKHDENQALRFVRFAMAFCRLAWDRCSSDIFNREQYTISVKDLKDFQKQCVLQCLQEKVFLDEAHDCSILPEETSEDVSLNPCEEENEETKNDLTLEKEGECEVDEEENREDVEEEIFPYNNEGEDIELSSSPVKQNSNEIPELVYCTKSGWEMTINQFTSTGRVVIDCPEPGYYHSDLIKKIKSASELHFQFDRYILCDQHGLVPICSSCRAKGHLHDVCPQFMPNLSQENCPSLPIPDDKGTLLNGILLTVARAVEPDEKAKAARQVTFKKIQSQILQLYPHAMLTHFGSSVNGFGCLTSDLDINMSFADGDEANQFMNSLTITKLVRKTEVQLRRSQMFCDIQGIRHAKVPIVKFKDTENGIEGDISFSNRLAVENTKLLKTYSSLEENCHALGLVLKHLVKKCNIGDASCGSLSSYAYIILLIHYLQQKGHLPVLQELYVGNKRPSNMIDGYDAWFQSDRKVIKAHWSPPSSPSKLSGLWLGFFYYYLYEFKHTQQVVTIRQKDTLLKMDKLWLNRDFAIEDPFELSHNLGNGLSRKMFCYILSVFNQVLLTHSQPTHVSSPMEINKVYFNSERLTMGQETPKDRGCRICGKIGHFARICPQQVGEAKSRKKKDDNKDILFHCIPLFDETQLPTSSQPNSTPYDSSMSLLHIPPRNDAKFLETQPFGSPLGREGFVIEPIILEVGGKPILLPVLTHSDPKVLYALAERQKPFAHRVKETSLQPMTLSPPANPFEIHEVNPTVTPKKDIVDDLNLLLELSTREMLGNAGSSGKKKDQGKAITPQYEHPGPGTPYKRQASQPSQQLMNLMGIVQRELQNDAASYMNQPSTYAAAFTSSQNVGNKGHGSGMNSPRNKVNFESKNQTQKRKTSFHEGKGGRNDEHFYPGIFQHPHDMQHQSGYSISPRNSGNMFPVRMDNPSMGHPNTFPVQNGRVAYNRVVGGGGNNFYRPNDLNFPEMNQIPQDCPSRHHPHHKNSPGFGTGQQMHMQKENSRYSGPSRNNLEGGLVFAPNPVRNDHHNRGPAERGSNRSNTRRGYQ